MRCHLFKSVQFDFEEGNFKSGLGIELLLVYSLLLLRNHRHVLLKLTRDPTDPILDTGFLIVPHAQCKSRG